MGKALACRDLGVDCDWEGKADSLDVLLQQAGAHAAAAHGMTEMSPEMATQLQSAIRDI